jgi:hypothetical protein
VAEEIRCLLLTVSATFLHFQTALSIKGCSTLLAWFVFDDKESKIYALKIYFLTDFHVFTRNWLPNPHVCGTDRDQSHCSQQVWYFAVIRNKLVVIIRQVGRTSSVDTETSLLAEQPWNLSWIAGRNKRLISLVSQTSNPALGPIPPLQWVPGLFPRGLKQPGRETDHSYHVPMLRINGIYLHAPICLNCVHRGYITFGKLGNEIAEVLDGACEGCRLLEFVTV